MKRFILVSFLFLGWAFYEMSGGSDFDPPQRAEVEPEKPAPKPYVPEETAAVVDSDKPNTIVFKPAAQAGDTADRELPDPAASVVARAANGEIGEALEVDQEKLDQVRNSLSQGLNLYPTQNANQPLTLASLGTGSVTSASSLDSPATPQAEEQAGQISGAVNDLLQETVTAEIQPDIREITGVRVNMRDGPGTIYPVIAKLNIGQRVEVLSDSGTGWLRLRTVPENQPGWISQSLVSKAAN